MSNVLVQESSLQAIADAIRYKTGGNATYKPREMAPAIRSIAAGGQGAALYNRINPSYMVSTADALICTLSGRPFYKYNNDPAYVAYFYYSGYTYPLLVSTTADGAKYKALSTVLSHSRTATMFNQTWYVAGAEYCMQGNITSTGGIAQKLEGEVSFPFQPTGDATVAQLLNLALNPVTENGIYQVPNGFDGFGDFAVNIPSPPMMSKSITENGTYSPSDDGVFGYSNVVVNVSGGGAPAALHTLTENQGSVWVNTGINVSPFSQFLFLRANGQVMTDAKVVAKSNIAIYTGSADVYSNIFSGSPQYNIKIFNNELWVSFNVAGDSAKAVYVFNGVL